MQRIPVPDCGDSDLLVRVEMCGVCPTDIKKIQEGTLGGPRVFGHETAGVIVRVGEHIESFRPGDRVALHHHVPCRRCHACEHRAFAQCALYRQTGITAGFEPSGGGYAEYVRVLPICLPGVVRIPDGVSLEEGAMLEPVNTVLKAVRMLPVRPNDVVLVAGQGPIGLLFTRLLTLNGQRVIATDVLPGRLEAAKRFGAWQACQAHDLERRFKLREITPGDGCDAAVVTVPSDNVFYQAQEAVRNGGTVLLFAHTIRGRSTPVDLARVCVDEKQLIGSYSSDITLQEEVARLVFSRQLDVRPLISHRFPLTQAREAIALAAEPTDSTLKVMVGST